MYERRTLGLKIRDIFVDGVREEWKAILDLIWFPINILQIFLGETRWKVKENINYPHK